MIRFRAVALMGLLIAIAGSARASTVSGRVVDPAGQPVANAQVFLEPGVTRPVRITRSNSEGEYTFEDVPPQFVGLFAYTPGRGFGGKSIQVGSNDVQQGHMLVLPDEGRISLKITDADDKPLSGARVIGVGLQQSRVGIPLQKLRRHGFQTPTSDSQGVVVVSRMPAGEEITVKIAHARHAQEVVRNIAPNSTNIPVQLNPGVLISGTVNSLQKSLPVPNAPILFINAEPPNDTSITRANSEGVYYIRLRPGRYFYESFGANFASVRKSQMIVSGEYETQQVPLVVAATGTIRGKVEDAATYEGVAGARILLETGGAPNSIATTGESGEFEFVAPEGQSVVRFRRALGYMQPPDEEITVTIAAHEQFEVPTFFVAPIPEFTISVQSLAEVSMPGAVARLIQPEQLGWYVANDEGVIDLSVASLPADGRLVGVVDHPAASAGTLFTLDARAKTTATITLKQKLPISGRVEKANGTGLTGWNVHCEYALGKESALRLWSTTTNDDGTFRYPAVLSDIPLRYWAESAGDEPGAASPVSFTATAAGGSAIPALVVSEGSSGTSITGDAFPWRKLAGSESLEDSGTGHVIVFASPTEFEVYLNTLSTMSPHLQKLGWEPVLVSLVPSDRASGTARILTGERPASSQTYVVNAAGTVVHETVGLPEFGLLRELGSN